MISKRDYIKETLIIVGRELDDAYLKWNKKDKHHFKILLEGSLQFLTDQKIIYNWLVKFDEKEDIGIGIFIHINRADEIREIKIPILEKVKIRKEKLDYLLDEDINT